MKRFAGSDYSGCKNNFFLKGRNINKRSKKITGEIKPGIVYNKIFFYKFGLIIDLL